jgi:PAS domain S-box-containing protein
MTEKKTVEEALKESEQRYRTLFDSAGDAIFVHDFEGRIQDVNQTACDRLGYSREELLNMNIRDINAPEYASQIPERYQTLHGIDQSVSQTVHLTLDGHQIPVEISIRRIERAGQNVVLNIVRDITERKRAENAELDQRIMAEALRDTASVVNSTLHLEQVLERILDNVGRVVLHDAVHIVLIEDDIPRVVCQRGYVEHGIESGLDTLIWSTETTDVMHQARMIGETIIIDDVHHHPAWRPLVQDNPKLHWLHSFVAAPIRRHDQLMGFIILNSAVPYFYTPLLASRLQTFADQAAIAIHNANLYEAERRARILSETFQQTAEALATSARLEDTLDLAIEQLSKVLHYDYAQILLVEGEKLRVVAARKLTNHKETLAIPGTNEYYSDIGYLYEPLASGQPLVIDNVQQSPYADYFRAIEPDTYCWAGVPLVVWEVVIGLLSVSSSQGGTYKPREIETMEAFAHQVALAIENSQLYTRLETSQTNLQQVQATLTRTARLSVAGEIAAGIAHQINNPLTAIVAQSYLLLKRLPVDDPNYNSIAIIRQAAYQAGTVVQHLLNFARPSTYSVHLIDINLSIQYAVSLIRAQIEPSAHVVENLASDLPMIKASSQHLEDLWINLLINAKDAVSEIENGEIQISSRLGHDRRTIEIEIADNGIGIAPEHQEHIFDPFFTTKKRGTGLGLPTCHSTVARHGGSIRVHSEPHRGSFFTVVLPVHLDNE